MTGLAHCDASKRGVWGLTKNVALELAEYGIAVNALAPAAIATPGATGGALDPDTLQETEQRIPMHRMVCRTTWDATPFSSPRASQAT